MWADIRTIRFEFYEGYNYPGLSESEPQTVVYSQLPTLPADSPPDLDQLVEIFEEEMSVHGRTEHILSDSRQSHEWGASGGGQEVIIQLMTDPGVKFVAETLGMKFAQGGAFGVGSLLAQRLLTRIQELRRASQKEAEKLDAEQREEMGCEPGNEPVYDSPPNLDVSINSAKSIISNVYDLEFEELDVSDAGRLTNHSEIIISHKSGRSFEVRVDRSGYAASIRPSKPS